MIDDEAGKIICCSWLWSVVSIESEAQTAQADIRQRKFALFAANFWPKKLHFPSFIANRSIIIRENQKFAS